MSQKQDESVEKSNNKIKTALHLYDEERQRRARRLVTGDQAIDFDFSRRACHKHRSTFIFRRLFLSSLLISLFFPFIFPFYALFAFVI